jgi:hypothetical protein
MNKICNACLKRGYPEDIIHVTGIYVTGSEGIDLCLQCRLLLSQIIQHMTRIAQTNKKQGWKVRKLMEPKIAEYKEKGFEKEEQIKDLKNILDKVNTLNNKGE